ncbi:hypothetical protein GP486_002709 [Trichoglossum hirsutum]|uniref:Uncharacterized protein n=1 Tax=Trichoglossum hirsutum TaxID=265104 RepID=A0A9P8LEP7_9PEZI|nr:hypothetical protein GP486_002709 [Trichoglossum hirsutum]
MSSEVYRNLGRGGAGNYYSKTDLEDVAKRAPQIAKDLEAQDLPSETFVDDSSSAQEYSHLGRGGAGNVALSASMGKGAASDSQTPVDSGQRNPMSGRGGAGNYDAEQRVLEAERAAKEAEQVEETRRRLQEEAKADVEKGLMPPQKAYMGQ